MSDGQRRHIIRREDGQWEDRIEGSSRAAGLYDTQAEAQAVATDRLQNRSGGGEVVIHGRDGKIRDSNTINRKDPFPPRG